MMISEKNNMKKKKSSKKGVWVLAFSYGHYKIPNYAVVHCLFLNCFNT